VLQEQEAGSSTSRARCPSTCFDCCPRWLAPQLCDVVPSIQYLQPVALQNRSMLGRTEHAQLHNHSAQHNQLTRLHKQRATTP